VAVVDIPEALADQAAAALRLHRRVVLPPQVQATAAAGVAAATKAIPAQAAPAL
jgi:hypothetical protein